MGEMTTIWTLDIKLAGWRRGGADRWSARIEVPDSFTLTDLHDTIQQLVDFDDDHLHEFFAGRTWRDRKATFGGAISPYEVNEDEEIPLSRVFPLPEGRRLFYNFDFGDDWLFEITRRPGTKQVAEKTTVATIVSEKGRPPEQYPDEGD